MESIDKANQLSTCTEYVVARLNLYDGRLVKHEAEIFFISQQFEDWVIRERCVLADVTKVEVVDSFMGRVVELHTSSSHWSLKGVADTVDLEQWIFGDPQEQIEQVIDGAEYTGSTKETSTVVQHRPLEGNEDNMESLGSVERSSTSKTLPLFESGTVALEDASNSESMRSGYPPSENPRVNRLREILLEYPEFQDVVREAVGGEYSDIWTEEALLCFMRQHFESYMKLASDVREEIPPLEMLELLKEQFLFHNAESVLVWQIFKRFAQLILGSFLLVMVILMFMLLFS